MKVEIGKPKNWFGPYQLAEALCFWVKPVEKEYGLKDKPDWVHNFGEWLAHGEVEPEQKVGERRKWSRNRKHTLLYSFLLWVDGKKKRKQEIRIDPWDTWSMDHTLAPIILPMLKQLKTTKHGYPTSLDLEDLPEHLRFTERDGHEAQGDLFDHIDRLDWDYGFCLGEAQWNWIMDEMIFAFEAKVKDDWQDMFTTGNVDLEFEQLEDGMSRLVDGPNHTAKYDWDGIKAYQARMSNGFRLFGKYFENLWD